MHLFLCMGMEEGDLRGVEEKPLCRSAIEAVAEDGSIQSVGMRGMHTELVRTTGEREEINEVSTILPLFTDGITRDSRFAMFPVHHLTRPVVGVWQERKGDEG